VKTGANETSSNIHAAVMYFGKSERKTTLKREIQQQLHQQ